MSSARSVLGAAADVWQRSIQLRVLVLTVVVTTIIIAVTGWAVLARVATGIVDERRLAALDEARLGFASAQAQFDAALATDATTQAQTLNQLIDRLSGPADGTQARVVILEGPMRTAGGQPPVRSTREVEASVVTPALRREVGRSPVEHWQYTEVLAETRVAPGTGQADVSAQPAVVVGRALRAPATGDVYQMFYVFSLADQAETLQLVRAALIVGGLVMIVLLGVLSWVVSRHVLNPVRLARRIAERFAAGSLEQRMHVRGRDDIARLSVSFNQMASSLQRQIRRLENLSRLQQRFVSDVSHELRTPLTTVRMASDVLHENRGDFDATSARSAELLKRELDRFEDLLSSLLDLSRFDAGAATLELDRVDLARLAREAAEDPILTHSELSVAVIGAESTAMVEADRRRIERILRNLVVNAVRYSGSDRLEIEVGRAGDRVSVAVRDFGVGLSGDENLRVFDRFWRGDPARSPGGTGLGLAIAHEDAVLHGGALSAWGSPGRGAEFVLTLPRTPHPQGPAVARPAVEVRYA